MNTLSTEEEKGGSSDLVDSKRCLRNDFWERLLIYSSSRRSASVLATVRDDFKSLCRYWGLLDLCAAFKTVHRAAGAVSPLRESIMAPACPRGEAVGLFSPDVGQSQGGSPESVLSHNPQKLSPEEMVFTAEMCTNSSC